MENVRTDHVLTTAQADLVALQAAGAGAYSFERYGAANWQAAARMLARRRYTARAIEAILRSKWTRWAADAANKSEGATAEDLARFLDTDHQTGDWKVAELIAQTFE